MISWDLHEYKNYSQFSHLAASSRVKDFLAKAKAEEEAHPPENIEDNSEDGTVIEMASLRIFPVVKNVCLDYCSLH